jgi:hypothetical protein
MICEFHENFDLCTVLEVAQTYLATFSLSSLNAGKVDICLALSGSFYEE